MENNEDSDMLYFLGLQTKIMASSPITPWEIDGEQWRQWHALFSWAPKFLQMVPAAMKLETLAPWKKSYDQPRQHIKKQRHIPLLIMFHLVKVMVFPVVIYGCKSWTIKKDEWQRIELWCWRRVLSHLDCKEIQPVHPKGDQSWIFIGETDTETETPIHWLPDVKSWHWKRLWC